MIAKDRKIEVQQTVNKLLRSKSKNSSVRAGHLSSEELTYVKKNFPVKVETLPMIGVCISL